MGRDCPLSGGGVSLSPRPQQGAEDECVSVESLQLGVEPTVPQTEAWDLALALPDEASPHK